MLLPSLISCLFLVGIPTTILSVYFAHRSWKRWRSPDNVVLLYQYGLVDRRKSESVCLPYVDIETLLIASVRLAGTTSYRFTVQTRDDRRFLFDEHLAQIKDLGQILQEQVVQHQLPEAIAAYNQGLPITFQDLVVTSSGLVIGKRRHLSWQELDVATVTQTRTRKSIHTHVEIRQKNHQKPWALLDQSTFPNMQLFFALLDHIQTQQLS